MYLNHDETRFVLFRRVASEVRPVRGAGNNFSKITHHLTAVANAEGEGVAALKEALKLRAGRGVEQNGLRPAFTRTQHVAVGKTTTGSQADKIIEANSSRNDVAHMNVNGQKSRTIKRRSHFQLAVDALLTQNCDARLGFADDERRGNVFVHIVAEMRVQAGIVAIEYA